MKRCLKLLFSIVFLLICCIPVYTMPWLSDVSTAEKRKLSDAPKLKTEQGFNREFTSQTDTWLSEHFSFRSRLVNILAETEAALFATSAEEQVIIGRNDWLFFSRTVDDFLGRNRLSDRQIGELGATLTLMEEYVTGNGAKFLVFSAPNKNTIYPDFMPARYPRAKGGSNLERLSNLLSGQPWYLELTELLRAEDAQVYHKRDTHWNNRGALLCYCTAMERLGLAPIDFAANGESTQKTWRGDLDEMLFPLSDRLDEQVVYAWENSYVYTSHFRSEEDLQIKAAKDGAQGSLLVFRDSFTNALLPFFAESFGQSEFTRIMPYRLNALDSGDYSAVVIEFAERNLPTLLDSAPIMPALQRDSLSIQSAAATQPLRLERENKSNMLHAYGTIPAKQAEHIYISCEINGEQQYYEAFPIYETEALGTARTDGETGFSAYLPEEAESAQISLFFS